MPMFLECVRNLIKEFHDPPTMGRQDGGENPLEIVVTTGGQDGLSRVRLS